MNEMNENTLKWYRNGRLHRLGGPAIIRPDGSEKWYRYGKRHRVGGPAIFGPKGEERWYFRGKLHRDDGGPAVISPEYGRKEWVRHGLLHRVDGPAEIIGIGENDLRYYWWVRGYPVWSFKELQAATKCKDADIIILKMKFGEKF